VNVQKFLAGMRMRRDAGVAHDEVMVDPTASDDAATMPANDNDRGLARQSPSAPAECDIVLEGGAASGVVYPGALTAIARRYRIRGIGGTSAGAMAAAVGAAAEYGRVTGRGGFAAVDDVPAELADGGLRRLFQPAPGTRPLLRLLLALTGGDRPDGRTGVSRILATAGAVITGYPLIMILSLLPGLAVIVAGVVVAGPWAIALGAVLLGGLAVIGAASAVSRSLVGAVPANDFGICSGLATDGRGPALTEWLSAKIDQAAGLGESGPLTFGRLWSAGAPAEADSIPAGFAEPDSRRIDLRTITTNLSEARPYQLPFDGARFFYDPVAWRRLFPPDVMAALESASAPDAPGGDDPAAWQADHDQALQHSPALRRLPDADQLPVVVAARMSLSMPLVISAVPLWTVRRIRRPNGDGRLDPTGPRRFTQVWFSDGGVTSNFPVDLFDAPLPARPTFAIDLRDFPARIRPSRDETQNVQWAHDNHDGLDPEIARWSDRGWAGVAGFAAAVFTAASSWYDNIQLPLPGFRDRIVRVLETAHEGGLNLAMSNATIQRLAERGADAAEAIMNQFDEPHYPPLRDGEPTSTGWDNHRWVRYRALLSVLPLWAHEYGRGRQVLGSRLLAEPPSYPFGSCAEQQLAAELDAGMQRLADVIAEADPQALDAITSRPQPVGLIRRVPQI
jgi:predicted acylesterase/phospholipase RssA